MVLHILQIFLFCLKQQAVRQKISQLHIHAGRILQCRNPIYRSLFNAVAWLLSLPTAVFKSLLWNGAGELYYMVLLFSELLTMGRSLLEGIGILVILFSLFRWVNFVLILKLKTCKKLCSFFFSLESTFAQKKRKSITTHLVAKWSNTPLMLEVREILNFL